MARYYNTYRMTPAERRARAQRIVQYREERSMLNKYLQEKEEADKLMREQEAARLSAENKEKERREVGFLGRGLSTVGDLLANVGTGAVKGLEGIVDLGAGLVGGIGGIFDDDFEDKVKDIIAKDWTGTYIGEPLQEALRYSYLKDGGIIENVASGVGQMLPAVAVTIATGGASAGTLAATVAEMASLGVTMAGAAGNATEEAFKEGADYWRGLGYGVASGAVEGATEKLLGGATSKIFGAGMLDGVVRSVAGEVAEQGARRVIKDAAGEAFEEALAELVNPALKSIYKGRDAFKEYGEADYWKGVGESALVGGLSSVAFSGTVGRAMKTSGKYADISGSLEANDSILEEVRRLSAAGKYTAEAEAQTSRVERANLMNIERTLKKSSESERAELISRFKLEAGFEADGSIKESVLKGLEAKENSATARYNRDYVSPELRGKEDVIEDDLRQISERTGVEAKVFAGELSEDAQKNYTKTKKALNALNKKGGNGVTLVITETNSAYKGGLVDDRTLYMPADQLESGDYAGTLVHEFTHFEEGSKAYDTMKDFLQSDEILVDDGEGGKVKLWEAARTKVRAKGYVRDLKELDAIIEKEKKGIKLTKKEAKIFDLYETELAAHETEIALGNEEFIDRMIAEDGKAVEKLVSRLLSLDKGLSSLKDKQARAQAKLIKEAERLYLKAAESAGNKRIVKMILAQHPELEDELTRMNEEKMQVSEKKVQMDLKDNIVDLKQKQFDIIQETNPMWDEYHVGIRSVEDIRTWEEVLELDDESEGQFVWGDFSREDALKALEENWIKIYSSYPIHNGTFVSTSYIQAREYVGGESDSKVYSMIVPLDAVAWINGDEGQYANKNIDNFAEIRYNFNIKFLHKNFPPENEIFSEAHRLATWWARKEDTKAGDCALISARNRWYVVEMFDDTKNYYQVEGAITKSDYNKVLGDIKKYGRSRKIKSILAASDGYDSNHRQHDTANGTKSSVNSSSTQHRSEDTKVVRLDTESTQGGQRTSGYRSGDSSGSSTHKQGTNVRKKDVQLSLKEKKDDLGDFFADDNDGGPVYKVSGGKVRKVIADNTRMKVYTRAESEQIVNQIVSEKLSFGELYGTIGGKSKNEVVDMLWSGLNSADIGERGKVALDVADYIINNAAVESIYDGEGLEVYRDTVATLKPYLHKMELASIKGDIKHRYDKDSSPYLLWGKRKGEVGLSPEQVAAELSEAGFKIEAESPADIFIEIHDAYKNASAKLKKEAKSALNIGLTAEEQKNLKQSIAREVLAAFDKGGSPSKLSAIVNKYIKQSNTWRDKYNAEKQRNTAISDTLYKVKKLKDLKTDAFLNASEHKPHLFKGSIEKLAAIETKGHLNKAGTRRIVSELAEWYVRDNPMLKENNLFDEEVEGMLYVISHGKGQLSTDEISMLGDIVSYFAKFVENYNKVYRNGKYEDAKPIAERYIKTMVENGKINSGFINKITGSKYLRTFGDPMTVMRRMDLYESGFYTEMMEQLREGAIGASVMEMEIREPLEKFFEKNKKFLQEIREHKIKYEGFEMSSAQAMLYYMTLNRKQALAGLAKSGFAYIDENNKTVRVPGFLRTEGMDQATLEQVFQLENLTPAAKAEQAKIYDQLTAAEKQYISLAEKIFNEDCKNAKREMDMRRKGFSNALEDYYVPIRRGNIAKSVDAGTFFDEMNRASNASFNKDTVRGAKNELFIESLDSVLDRHIRGVSQYANLATVIDAYDTIFNLAVNDNPNKPESVRTVSENVWRDGAQYFKDVISDIQGIPAESRREGYQLIKQLRSGYAKYQLGANPKVWFTQLSSFCAATSILDVDSITQGFGIDAKDVDEWCALAKLRNSENTVAAAQGLFDEHSKPGKVLEATGKFGDVLMTPIGWVDRFVVTKLFGACQVQVAKNGGAKVGTKANKQAAGELLQKVILETQQNATATDRSAAMRSGNELMKTITMFTADSMKVMGRVIDSVGEVSVLKARLKTATADERTKLETRLKAAEKQARRSIASLVSSAAFMAVIAQLFRTLYNKDDEDDNIALNMTVDAAGNMIGGLPGIKDVYGFFADGYGLDNYAYSAINDLFESARDIMDVGGSAFSGDLEGRELASSIKKMSYAAGQVLGLPTRNAYNVVYGLTKRFSPSTAYKIDDAFYNQSYRADLMRAIEKGDDKMIATIAGLMLNENIGGIEDSKSRQELDRLISAGFDMIPRATASSITYDGEEYVLDASDKKDFEKIYTVANEVLADLVKMSKYQSASDDVKASAISYIYKVYWDLAVQEIVGEDLETKTVLFAEAIDIEKLALIVATASMLKADTDKSGKAVSGSRKKKIQEYVNSLDLKAVEKYMIMGYLGYKNVKGEAQVKAYINKLKLTKSEKEKLIAYSGY